MVNENIHSTVTRSSRNRGKNENIPTTVNKCKPLPALSLYSASLSLQVCELNSLPVLALFDFICAHYTHSHTQTFSCSYFFTKFPASRLVSFRLVSFAALCVSSYARYFISPRVTHQLSYIFLQKQKEITITHESYFYYLFYREIPSICILQVHAMHVISTFTCLSLTRLPMNKNIATASISLV